MCVCVGGGGGGGAGVQFQRPENSLDNFFSPQLISMLFQGLREGPTFPGRGVQMLISIETHIT